MICARPAIYSERMAKPSVSGFYHEPTGSIAYIVRDPASAHAAIVDPVLDFDEKAGRVSTEAADALIEAVRKDGLKIDWILDTHAHADHFSAAGHLKDKLGAPIAIGVKIVDVQRLWRGIYNQPDFQADGSQWDRLFADGDTFQVGDVEWSVMHSPGHTSASITYLAGDCAFMHDTLFQPDSGTARCDFPGGNAGQLYDSIQRILALPDATRLFTGHDYRPNGRPAQWESTVSEQKRSNIHFKDNPSRETYVAMREKRDKTLPMPRLILDALQVNIRAGRLPPPEDNGRSYLKIPIGVL
jgi:glyoxylase-like metal-dependent hydrolase (beta-lactamase superfamily II)